MFGVSDRALVRTSFDMVICIVCLISWRFTSVGYTTLAAQEATISQQMKLKRAEADRDAAKIMIEGKWYCWLVVGRYDHTQLHLHVLHTVVVTFQSHVHT